MNRCFWIVLLLAANACARQQTEIAQPIALPPAFSQSGAAHISEKWWHSFNDPALGILIERALAQNFSIKQAYDRLQQARALARRQGSERFPTVDLSASYVRTRTEDDGSSTSTAIDVGLSASYELDLWGKIAAGVKASELDAQAQQADTQAAAISLSAEVAHTWYRLVAAHQRVALLKKEAETQNNIQTIIKEQFKFGKVRAADVYRQEQLMHGTKATLVRAETDEQLLGHQMMVLLGYLPKQQFDYPDFTFPILPALPKTGIPSEILDQRPDVRSAWLGVLAADQRVTVARTDRYPRLSISASLSSDANSVGDLFDAWVFRLIANIVQPLFDGGQRRAEQERQQAILSEHIHAYAEVVLGAVKEVEDALVQEQQQQKYMGHLSEQLRVNNIVLDRSKDLYKQGQGDYLRVLESLNSHLNLQQDHIAAARDLIQHRIRLYRALAGYWSQADMQEKPVETEVSHE